MSATPAPASLSTCLVVTDSTPIAGHFDDLPGLDPLGTLMLDLDESSGLSITFTSTAAVERMLDQVRAVHHGFLAADRKRDEEQAWSERRPDGRPLLRAVEPVAVAHPSLSGAVR